MKKRVFILTLYGDKGPSSKYRIFQYVNHIKGYADVRVEYFWPNVYSEKYIKNKKKYAIVISVLYLFCLLKRVFQLLFVAPQNDVIIIQKAIIPKINIDFLTGFKRKGIRIIFDVDDAVYVDKHDNSHCIAQKSDIVLCGSRQLCEYYKNYNNNIVFMPTVEDDNPYKLLRHDTFQNKIIGWLGTSVNLPNIRSIVTPINNIIKRHPEVTFYLICDKDGGYGDAITNFKYIKWEQDTALSEMSDFTIGIMPLEDNEINRGKCGFKLIQYMTMGIPIVGSPVGENERILSYGGIPATSEDEWESALECLLFDEDLYRTMRKRIAEGFLSDYSYNKNCEILQNSICL